MEAVKNHTKFYNFSIKYILCTTKTKKFVTESELEKQLAYTLLNNS